MTKLLSRDLATSLTALFFAVIGVSGVMLFFHLSDEYVKKMHEIIGLAFIAVVGLHLFFNRKALKKYFSKTIFFVVTLATLAMVALFVSQANTENPKKAILTSVLQSSIQSYVDFLHVNSKTVQENLQKAGIKVTMQESIEHAAQANKISPFKLVHIIISQPDLNGK